MPQGERQPLQLPFARSGYGGFNRELLKCKRHGIGDHQRQRSAVIHGRPLLHRLRPVPEQRFNADPERQWCWSYGIVSVNPNLQADTSSGNLINLGDGASGALLQSIGGGGGFASYSCSNSGNAQAPISQSGISLPFTASACFQNTKTILLAEIGSTPASFQGSLPTQNQIAAITINATSESASTVAAINFASNNLILSDEDFGLHGTQ